MLTVNDNSFISFIPLQFDVAIILFYKVKRVKTKSRLATAKRLFYG